MATHRSAATVGSLRALMEPHAITVDGDRVAGEGPVLLLVHGMAGSSLTWQHFMPALAERFTVLAPDEHIFRIRPAG